MAVPSDYLEKTLQQLGEPQFGEIIHSSHLVTECHRLQTVPLRDFSVEDLRIMIGQECSLEYLIPAALSKLEVDPWASGDFHHGDLLLNVIGVDTHFWRGRSELRKQFGGIVRLALERAQRKSRNGFDDETENVLMKLKDWRD